MSRAASAIILLTCLARSAAADLPPVPYPPENPYDEATRILGKVLFWDAQLSSDGTIACGTCHVPGIGGGDPRLAAQPGADGIFGTPDDSTTSPGMVRADASGAFVPDSHFGFEPQATRRGANSTIMSGYAPHQFWDGRAGEAFVDPVSGAVVIPAGGSLETQALVPILSHVEMAFEDRTWDDVVAKLTGVHPLALMTDVPGDMQAAVLHEGDYPGLFASAFGDPAITPARIGLALATYERTLVPDDTPWDRYVAGDDDALTPLQQEGLALFMSDESKCADCHAPPHFTDFSYRNIGLRPWQEDPGRFEVTGEPDDRGRFKVPSLRAVALKVRHTHLGRFPSVAQTATFYTQPTDPAFENVDPLIAAITIDVADAPLIAHFIETALADERVTNETFPFDRPTLHTEIEPNPAIGAEGVPGQGGLVPMMVAPGPPNLGNDTFRFGLADARGGATATLHLYRRDPESHPGEAPALDLGPFTLPGNRAGTGFTTAAWPLARDARHLLGDVVFARWDVADRDASGGVARSPVARVRVFEIDPTSCGLPADLDCDGAIGALDLGLLLERWGAVDGFDGADLDDDGDVDFRDLVALLSAWN